MKTALNQTEKKQLVIFAAIAFGVPVIMGILMAVNFYRGVDVSVFPNAQMFTPAAGAMLAMLVTREAGQKLPVKFYIGFLAVTAVMLLLCVLSLFLPAVPFGMISQYVIILGSVVCWVLMLLDKKEARRQGGMSLGDGQKRRPWIYVILFLILYFARIFFSYVFAKDTEGFLLMFRENPYIWINMAALPINFFLVYMAFFGEEYGWRGFLQPLLQKRFGKRGGVILLGVVWGLWHLPINLFYYSPQTWLQSVLAQQLTCIGLAVFFGWVQMKTRNIWIPVIMHYLNNNLIAVLAGTADVIENQVIAWGDLLVLLVLNGVLFASFILAKEYRNGGSAVEKQADENSED